MRVPLLALLPIALGTLASLASARFADNVGTREIHARSFHDGLALHQRDILASLSTRELIDALSEQLERREGGIAFCQTCNTHWDANREGEGLRHKGHDTKQLKELWWCSKCNKYLQTLSGANAHRISRNHNHEVVHFGAA